MAAVKSDISKWFDRGVDEGATHMIVACDAYDWEDYPVYVMPEQDAKKEVDSRNGVNMDKVMEVYNLSMDKDAQLSEHRAFNY